MFCTGDQQKHLLRVPVGRYSTQCWVDSEQICRHLGNLQGTSEDQSTPVMLMTRLDDSLCLSFQTCAEFQLFYVFTYYMYKARILMHGWPFNGNSSVCSVFILKHKTWRHTATGQGILRERRGCRCQLQRYLLTFLHLGAFADNKKNLSADRHV